MAITPSAGFSAVASTPGIALSISTLAAQIDGSATYNCIWTSSLGAGAQTLLAGIAVFSPVGSLAVNPTKLEISLFGTKPTGSTKQASTHPYPEPTHVKRAI